MRSTTGGCESYDEYKDHLAQELTRLESPARIAFAACIAERLMHHYLEFSRTQQWGDSQFFTELLEAVWDHAAGQLIPEPKIVTYERSILKHTPDMDEFSDPDALSFCIAAGAALDCCRTNSVADVINAAEAGVDVAAGAVDFPLDDRAGFDRAFWTDAAVQAEVARQLHLLERVKEGGAWNWETLHRFRSNCRPQIS